MVLRTDRLCRDTKLRRSVLTPPRNLGKAGFIQILVVVGTLAGIVASPAAADSSSAAPAAAEAPQREDGRYLPLNTWVRLETVPTSRFIPKRFVDCSEVAVRSHPVARRAAALIPGGGTFVYFGGGGQSHPGNDIELFDIAANTWVQQYDPECLPSCCTNGPCTHACYVAEGVGTTDITPLGRPYTEHTYQLIAYNPDRQKFSAALTSGMWEWDPRTREWDRLTPERPQSADIATKMLVYDPDLQTVLYFATTAANHTVFRFDYATVSWHRHDPIPEEIAWAEIWSAYDSKEHKYLVSHLRGKMWIYDALAGTWTWLRNAPTEILFTSSLSYDPVEGVFLIGKHDRTNGNRLQLWSYRIATDTWTRLELAGEAPRTGLIGLPNDLAYDSVWQRFYYINVRGNAGGGQGGAAEGDLQTWAFRIGGPLGPGDANCDGAVTAADFPRLIASLDQGSEATCGAMDIERNGTVDASDVSAIPNAIFRTLP